MKNKTLILLLSLLASGAGVLRLSGEDLVRVGAEGLSLVERWNRAESLALEKSERHCYVGYSISRLMKPGHHTVIGSRQDGSGTALTMAQRLGEKATPDMGVEPDELARRMLEGKRGKLGGDRQPRELALLFEMVFEKGRWQIKALNVADLDVDIHLQSIPVFWLGQCDKNESLAWLGNRFQESRVNEMQEHLVAAIGLHDDPGRVLPLLDRALNGKYAAEVREAAVFWLGEQNVTGALERLDRLWQEERDEDMLDAVIFALSRMELESALDRLIEIARGEPRLELKRKAIFWLSQMASKRVCPVLEGIVKEAGETEKVREHAVFALSQHEDGLKALIRLAKGEGQTSLRKRAIFWLGQRDEKVALDTILELLEK